MARARNIKPGFFLNDELAELPMAARLLFAGLWCIADREGRLEDKPKKIKAQVLPYDDCNVDDLLNDLHNSGFIIRYVINDEKYIQITKFEKHQNPHKNEAPSTIPPISEEAQYKHSTSTIQTQEMHSTNPADPLNLIPDSLSTDSLSTDSLVPEVAAEAADESEQENPIQPTGAESVRFAEKNFGRPLSPAEAEDIFGWIETFKAQGSPDPDAIVVAGLKRCVDNNTRKMSYLKGILVDWLNHGVITLDHIASRDEEWNSNKERKRRGNPEGKSPPEKTNKYEQFYL
jgi:DnaD/phage-associated family protein